MESRIKGGKPAQLNLKSGKVRFHLIQPRLGVLGARMEAAPSNQGRRTGSLHQGGS